MFKTLLITFISLAFVFCSESSETDEGQEQITDDSISQDDDGVATDIDDFNYLVINRETAVQNLYEIGNNSGEIIEVGQIPGTGFNVFFNTVVANESKVYYYEQNFDPFEGYIYVHNKTQGTTEKTTINLDTELFGNSPGIISMDWDPQKETIIAIVKSDVEFASGVSKVVEINPDSLEIIDLEIDLGNSFFTISTTLKNSKLYISGVNQTFTDRFEDFIEVDLSNKTLESLQLQDREGALRHLGSNELNSEFFGYSKLFGTQRGNATEPFILNIESKVYQPLLPELETSNFNTLSKTYFDKDQNTFVSFSGANGKDIIITYHIITKEAKVVELSEFGVIQNAVVVGKVEK